MLGDKDIVKLLSPKQQAIEHISNDPENMARSWKGLTPDSPNKLCQPPQTMLKIVLNRVQDHFLKYYHSYESGHTKAPELSDFRLSKSTPRRSLITFQCQCGRKRVEIFMAIRIKLDYKPQRVNYMALKKGKTIELMNFFHFEGSDMVSRYATLTGCQYYRSHGVVGHRALDVKANQLADVISGIALVQLIVLNLGSGITDLVLLPIEAEMKKTDGCLSCGIQKGMSSFVEKTTLEVIKMGGRLAIRAQVVLEKAESILGAKSHQELCSETIKRLPSPDPNLAPHHLHAQARLPHIQLPCLITPQAVSGPNFGQNQAQDHVYHQCSCYPWLLADTRV
ncbi:hypothetical protein VP01_958g1 [Puccinia sorghi]|uniref:Autophagy-related protein 2 n=1 Tax=Puccinia sorghi TaxID=27349 RepID=A0A0L6U669_9BASI|nr:hypothetical protein VP01_958g1 [Puccinia sorghi]